MIFEAELRARDELYEQCVRYHFVAPKEALAEYQPGQYCMVEVGDIRRRPYSIESINVGEEHTSFSLLLDLSPDGVGSKYFLTLLPGMNVLMQGPFGVFTLEEGYDEYLFIAGGVGIAPLMPMIRTLLHHDTHVPPHIRLVHGVSNADRLISAHQLGEWQHSHPNFTWISAQSNREEKTATADHSVFAGRTTDWIQTEFNLPTEDVTGHATGQKLPVIYLCGGPHMVRDCRAALLAKGVPQDHIRIETFS